MTIWMTSCSVTLDVIIIQKKNTQTFWKKRKANIDIETHVGL